MTHKFPNISDVPEGLDEGLATILSEIKEVIELALGRRKADYTPIELYEIANKQYVDSTGLILRSEIGITDFDFTESDLTTDGTWHTLDLSNIVPADAYAVLLNARIKDDAVDSEILFRKDADSPDANNIRIRTQVVDKYNDAEMIVFCGANRLIQYKGSNLTFTEIDILVSGWFIGN